MTREPDRARRVFQALILVVALAVAFLGGMLVERLQSHADRDAMLRRYDQALREHRARIAGQVRIVRRGRGEADRRRAP